MTNILKVELFRLKKSTAFWVCFGLCAGLPLLSFLTNLMLATVASGYADVPTTVWELLKTENGVFDYMTDYATFSEDYHILTIIAVAAVLGKEFSDGTIRNMILANKRRSDIYVAFWLLSLIVGGIYMLAQFASTLLFLGTTSGFGEIGAGPTITTLLCYFFMGVSSTACVSTMICMFLFATKKTSQTVLFPLLICFLAPSIVSALINIVIAVVAYNTDNVVVLSAQAEQCIPFVNWTTFDILTPEGLNVAMVIVYNLIFSGLFFIWAYFPFRKADLR